jgi:hypothetical protein
MEQTKINGIEFFEVLNRMVKQMKSYIIIIASLVLISAKSFAQCSGGPTCPVCSGGSSGSISTKNDLVISALGIPTLSNKNQEGHEGHEIHDDHEEYLVANIRYGVFDWLDVGVGYAFGTRTLIWSLRMQPLAEKEDKWYPGLIVGIGSVRTGGNDQSVYGMLAKTVEFNETFAMQGYVGMASVFKDFGSPFFLSGLSVIFSEKFTLYGLYDGASFHEGLSWTATDNFTLSFLMIESAYPALSVSYKFGLGK